MPFDPQITMSNEAPVGDVDLIFGRPLPGGTMTLGALKILRIEVDGHFHGSSDVPKPWVARIDGADATYGLAREFVQKLNDYRAARRANSGNTYGVVASFPLHEGQLYEVSRLRGKPSKRYVAREFIRVAGGKFVQVEPIDVLAAVDGHDGPAIEHTVPDGTRIARIERLGTPAVCGFVLAGRARDERLYRLRDGYLHEVSTETRRYLAVVSGGRLQHVTHADALDLLRDQIGAAA